VLNFLGTTRVYLAVGATDLRKSFDTLAGVVRNSLRLDPLSGHLFAFTNSRRNRLKILFWDRNGWWLCSKRLESGTLSWPTSESASVELSSEELMLLLSGIDLSRTQRRPWLDRRPKGTDENSTESP
jgi:transposase